MADEGRIWRDGDAVCVSVRGGGTHLLDIEGVTCTNPDAPEAEREYIKRFVNKPIYLPGEYDRAVKEQLTGKDVIVIGANGYSSLKPETLRAWGVAPGAYEAACEGILKSMHQALTDQFPGIIIRFAHGASDMGIDKVIIKVARDLNCGQLGHNCPKWMFYVLDDDVPCYVANTSDEYAERFIDSLDILVCCNGRDQAFKHDLTATLVKLKYLIPVNVLRAVSTTGGPPAVGPDGKIEDAVAAFEQRIRMVGQHFGLVTNDPFCDLVSHVCDAATGIARQHISPARAYGQPPLLAARGVRLRSA